MPWFDDLTPTYDGDGQPAADSNDGSFFDVSGLFEFFTGWLGFPKTPEYDSAVPPVDE